MNKLFIFCCSLCLASMFCSESFGQVVVSGTLRNLDGSLLNRPTEGPATNIVASIEVLLRDVNRAIQGRITVDSDPKTDTFRVEINASDADVSLRTLFLDITISAPEKQSANFDGLLITTQGIQVVLPKSIKCVSTCKPCRASKFFQKCNSFRSRRARCR